MSSKKQTPAPIRSSAAEMLTYVASTGDPQGSIEIRYEDENIWLTQKTMAQLYDVSVKTINYHIKKIFDDTELSEDSVIRKFRITATDGKPYTVQHYSLQMIIGSIPSAPFSSANGSIRSQRSTPFVAGSWTTNGSSRAPI